MISVIETHGIYTVSSSTHSPPFMSLITRSSEMYGCCSCVCISFIRTLGTHKFTQPHTSVNGRLLFRQINVFLHQRLQPHFTKFITAAGAGRFTNILLEFNPVWLCQTPNHNRPQKGGSGGFPQPFSKSLLRNVLVEYAVLVIQLLGGRLSPSCVVGVQEPPKVVHFGVYQTDGILRAICLGGLKIPTHYVCHNYRP